MTSSPRSGEASSTTTIEGATADPDDDSGDPPARERSALREAVRALEGTDLLTLAVVAVLPVAGVEVVYGPTWAPKFALGLMLIGPGLLALVRLALAGRTPARVGLAFLAVVGLSALVSPHPQLAFFGTFNGFGSVLLYASLVGAWAAGTALTPAGRRALPFVVCIGMGITTLLVWAAGLGLLGDDGPFVMFGRPSGLVGNPVYAGALLCMFLVLVVGTWAARRPIPTAIAAGVVAGALNLAGSRVALVSGVVVALAAVALHARTERSKLVLVVVPVAIVIGLGASLLAPGTASSTGRLSAGGANGLGHRVTAWGLGIDGWKERPVLGWGPGMFRSATASHIPIDFAQEDPASYFGDAHDIGIELLTTLGLVGLVAAAAWVVVTAREARGGGALAALAFGFTLLLEPNTPSSIVPAVLLGASLPAFAFGPAVRRGMGALGVAGIAVGATFLLGCHVLLDAFNYGDVDAGRRAARLLPPYTAVAVIESRTELASAPPVSDTAARRAWQARVFHLADKTRRIDPTAPDGYAARAQAERQAGHNKAALRWYLAALERAPYSPDLLSAAEGTARAVGDDATARRLHRDRCLVLPDRTC